MRLRVLAASSDFQRGSGVTRVLLRWVRGLPPGRFRFDFLDGGQATGAPAEDLPIPSWRIRLWSRRPWIPLIAILRLAWSTRLRRQHVVHVHHRRVLAAVALAKWLGRHRFRTVYTQHSCFPPTPVLRLLLPRRVTAVGEESAASIRACGYRGRVVVLGNPVAFPSVPAVVADPHRAVAVARLDALKNHQVLIEAWALLRARGGAQLDLFGEGPLADDLRARAVALGLAGSVAFHGFVADADRRFATGLFAILPSRREGLPTVVVEAAAAGRATLMARAPGMAECVPPDASLPNLLSPDDPEEWAEALVVWFADPAVTLAEGERFRRHLRARHGAEAVLHRLADVYLGR